MSGRGSRARGELPYPMKLLIALSLAFAALAPAASVAEAPIQPGAQLGDFCTLNFIFASGANRYVGTAGHCVAKDEVARVAGSRIGITVFSRDDDTLDFALIKIDPGKLGDIDPSVRGIGGPTGVATRSHTAVGDSVSFHGYGLLLGDIGATRTRSGILMNHGASTYAANMPAVNGDSGGPVIHARTGRALGIVARYGTTGFPPSTDVGPTIEFVLGALAAANLSVTLVTA